MSLLEFIRIARDRELALPIAVFLILCAIVTYHAMTNPMFDFLGR